ncbi:DUF397 domain-containing protein [Streptomyces prunicolor]|uniref:DUF397 domain-containing protein n=1 Tax=Streptomyces prunicolor TaxID=67348 RepID=UPI002258040E|nr:DUF397 domain-containing protein [Streptomyces prunicolor]MCX5234886.1 DUF397 domain-containing protein [Streptomyces prunicolor]
MSTPDTWQKSSFSGGADGNNCVELATTPIDWQKSSFSGNGDGDNCVELASTWQKSSFSGGGDGNACLELATTPTTLHLRESDTPTTHLTTTPTALAALLDGIRSGTPFAGRPHH